MNKQNNFTEADWDGLPEDERTRYRNFVMTHYRKGCPIPAGWHPAVRWFCDSLNRAQVKQFKNKTKHFKT